MDSILTLLTLIFIAWLFIRFWKGLVIFCSRHGKLWPFLYFVFLPPIAFLHILLTGFSVKEKIFSWYTQYKKEIALNKKEAAKYKKEIALDKKKRLQKKEAPKEEAAIKLFIEIKDENWKITEKEKAWQDYLSRVENHIKVTRAEELKNEPKKSSRQLAKEKKKAWQEYFNAVSATDSNVNDDVAATKLIRNTFNLFK